MPLYPPKTRWHESRRVAVFFAVLALLLIVGNLTGVVPDAIGYMLGYEPHEWR